MNNPIGQFSCFVVGLSHAFRAYDSIWAIVDLLTKLAHFLPVRSTFSAKRLART